ncbi:hypothetical protein, partial [Arthrobacter sp. H14]|uniref:hypothetical protein n=1 Tax=Arthrobacter sp. H14 TaxID=1312959 RepID=UPI0005670B3E
MPTPDDDPASSDKNGQGYRAEIDLESVCQAADELFREVAEDKERANISLTDGSPSDHTHTLSL